MGTTLGRENPAVTAPDLWAEPFAFDFIQAVRLLQARASNRGSVGHDTAPGHEVVRFAVHRDLGFPASQIHQLLPGSTDLEKPPLMTVAFIGLIGPSGVLPTHYTELVIEDSGTEDEPGALADFLDMFHHRLISLFYRAWERNHPQLSPDPAVRASFHGFLLALVGECSGPTHGPHADELLELLRHAGLWSQRRRTSEGLRILLTDRVNDLCAVADQPSEQVDIEIVPFIPRWSQIEPDRKLKLQRTTADGLLGHGAILGSRARDWQSQFRVRIGPLTRRQFDLLQPPAPARGRRSESSAFQEIAELTARYVGPEFDFDLILVLRADQIPPCRLDRDRKRSRLGRAWLITRKPSHDCECIIPRRLY
jgi:type VI secretion system protein ImpH